ncbi:MAG: methylmalonyl-CoA carboxyltransferase, partial [Actinobacteria bacterium]|nr:methylmalonyl-CoA carboxyltransferase [Actinomycetota bacterium]NIU69003.1 methylmalonyl-CoA carboxyltransferase [Actinomycetota bacterium]NIV89042.1 methylmalonyl-CoA carboxyltransferase [Actinomycetota bacterium]NIW30855.1 methylmalonyl-CoA carboxyltransferase [Actinomycetota bacterium]NIX23240.1 methylmalonyl-CoA carboxyltransferase [Actinomycetota bacterium]
SEEAALDRIRQLLSYLPQNNVEDPPRAEPSPPPEGAAEELESIVPDQPRKPYDMVDVI